MVSSKACKTISFAISLLVVVISLTSVAVAATAPSVVKLGQYTPGFGGAPGKMAVDAGGNLYVTDFWAKGIVKLDRQGNKLAFIPTVNRPSAVAVLSDGRLVVAMSAPQKYVAFYSQSGDELSQFTGTTYHLPAGVAVDDEGKIYVLDTGNFAISPKVKVFDAAGAFLAQYGSLTSAGTISTTGSVFKTPMGIAFEKAAKEIYVVDTMNHRVQIFSKYSAGFVYSRSIGRPLGRTYGYTPIIGSQVLFADPVDVAFDYSADGTTLNRVYVADKGRDEISAVDPTVLIVAGVYGTDLMRINATSVTGASMKLPASLAYRVTNGTKGMLYVGSAAATVDNSVLALGLDGAAQVGTVALAITSTVPATTTMGDSPLTVSGTVSPVAAVNCNVNGGADTLATPSGNSWSVSLALQNGYNYILCKASDGTNYSYAQASTYFTGTVGGAVTPIVTSPATGIYTNNATVTLTGTTSVANANVKLSNPNANKEVTTVSGADSTWSATIDLAEGANVITASSWKTGTATGTASVTVNADYTPPSMNLSFLGSVLPANAPTTVNAIQNLDAIVVEKNLGSIEVNGALVDTKISLPAADNTYFSAPVTLVRGSNTIDIKITDLAGNVATASRTVILAPEKPGLTVALPADNSYRSGTGAVSANGTVDAVFNSVDAAGTPVTPAGGNWSTAAMAVTGGFKTYTFSASGTGQTTVSEKRTINADAAYAQLAITNPPVDIATKDSSVILSGVSPSKPTISIDGVNADPLTVSFAAGSFSYTVNFTTEGEHVVKVIVDAATTAVRNIIYDATLPALTLQSNTQTMPTLVTGTIEPSAKMKSINASLKGSAVAVPLSAISFDPLDQSASAVVWHANLATYTYDTLSFTTEDPAGNTKTLAYVKGIPSGDIDGDGTVRLSDAMACLRHVAGKDTLVDEPRFQADVGSLVEGRAAQDGEVTVVDAVLILQKAYGLMTF